MLTRRTILTSLAASVLSGQLSRVCFGEGLLRCRSCACSNNCETVCRLVCEEKKVQVVVWGIKHEEFCAPDPSCPDHDHCEEIRASTKPTDPCSVPKVFRWTHWTPAPCGTVYTKKKLMKKTVTKTVPSYKWVVEDLCPSCQAKCAQLAVPSGTEVPPAPQLAGVPVLPYATAATAPSK